MDENKICCYRSNSIYVKSTKPALLKSWTLQKILIILKNVLNKSCVELNFPQKTQWKHISPYPRSRARGLYRFALLKYYNALKWESLQLTAARNTDYIKNASYKSCAELNFLQKKRTGCISLSAPGVEVGAPMFCFFVLKYYTLKWESSKYIRTPVDHFEGNHIDVDEN